MALYYCKITFTGELLGKMRPHPKTIVVKSRTIKKAADIVHKHAKKIWPYHRFTVDLVDGPRIVE